MYLISRIDIYILQKLCLFDLIVRMMEASSILSKLESSPDLENIYSLISNHLLPFTSTLTTTTKKPPKLTKILTDNTRALAKQFLPFLNRALSLLPKRLLAQSPKLDSKFAAQLFDCYILCLNCLDLLSCQLSGKAYSVHLQRVRLVHCYLFWERYQDADSEGVSLLRSLCKLGGDGSRNEYVPDVTGEIGKDHEFAWLVVEIVVSLVKCVAMRQSKIESDYRRLLVMINEITPWFRYLFMHPTRIFIFIFKFLAFRLKYNLFNYVLTT